MTCPHNYIIDKWELERSVVVLQVKCQHCGHEAIVSVLDDEKPRIREALEMDKLVPWTEPQRVREKGRVF